MLEVRPYTKRLTEMCDDGIIDRNVLLVSLLMWMGEQQVKQFYNTIESELENERQNS